MSPLGKSISVIVDEAIDVDAGYVVGANKADYHTKGFTVSRDLEKYKQVDLRQTQASDVGPDKKTPIKSEYLKNSFLSFTNSFFTFFFSKYKKKGNKTKNPTKNLTPLNKYGPMKSMPVS